MKPSQSVLKFTKVNPTELASPVAIVKAWKVTEISTGNDLGFVASAVQSYVGPSGRVYSPVQWGFAISQDEFRSGLQFPYRIRLHAVNALLGDIKR